MAVNGGRRLHQSGSYPPSPQPGERLKAFLHMLASRQRLRPSAAANPKQLTMAIEHVAQSNLPADSKRDAMFELMHHRVVHAACIVTLNAVIVRDEKFVWQPE